MKKFFKSLFCVIIMICALILPSSCRKYNATDYYIALKSQVLTDATKYKYITFNKTVVDNETKNEDHSEIRYYSNASSDGATMFSGVEISDSHLIAVTNTNTYDMRVIVKPIFSDSGDGIAISSVDIYNEVINENGIATDTYVKTESTEEKYREIVSSIKADLYSTYKNSIKTVADATFIDETNSKKNTDGYTIVYHDANDVKYTANLSRLTTYWTKDNGFFGSVSAWTKKEYVITKLVAETESAVTTVTWSIAYFTNESIKAPDATKVVEGEPIEIDDYIK